jgi:hypothetical protein
MEYQRAPAATRGKARGGPGGDRYDGGRRYGEEREGGREKE